MGIGKKGFTLVEIIVSLAIMTIVAGAVGAFVVAGNNSYMRGNKELTLQEEAQLTANQMIDLIRKRLMLMAMWQKTLTAWK